MALLSRERLAEGVYTASAGNMAQGVGWNAKRLGIPCTVVVPENAPNTKLAAIGRLGAKAVKLPYARWWQVLEDHGYPGIEGHFIHPVSDETVIAGNATIGLEILEDLPDVNAVVVPFGGGGLSCGIAAALRALRPETRVWASEVETAAPFSASLDAGRPVSVSPCSEPASSGRPATRRPSGTSATASTSSRSLIRRPRSGRRSRSATASRTPAPPSRRPSPSG